MLDANDTLQLYRGRDYVLTDTISIKQPTIGEVCDFGEKRYFSLISTLIATPYEMMAQLDMAGIEWYNITAFQLFCLLIPNLSVDDTSILFGDTDFSKYHLDKDDSGVILRCGNSVISEPVYMLMTSYIRNMHRIAPKASDEYKDIGNEMTRKKLLSFAYDEIKYAKKKKYKSQLINMISFLVNNCNSKSTFYTVWDLPIYAFFESVERIQVISATNSLSIGMYSNADLSKVNKEDFNALRSLS